MQYKKEEVKNAILSSAEKEFFEKGFEGASIRIIVKNANTTIGNFYNYFENKSSVFEALVKEEYCNFVYFIENHHKIDRPDFLWEVNDALQWKSVLKDLLNQMLPTFTDKFVLLVECSKGTKYEITRKQIIDLLENHFIEHEEKLNVRLPHGFAGVIAEQFINGIIMILKQYRDKEKAKEMITEYILFVFLGAMGLMKEK